MTAHELLAPVHERTRTQTEWKGLETLEQFEIAMISECMISDLALNRAQTSRDVTDLL